MTIQSFGEIPFIEATHYGKGRKKPISMIILHYTAGGSMAGTVNYLASPKSPKVSSHFIVDRKTNDKFPSGIVQMVSCADRAWHAGKSEWQGQKWLNTVAVGIEICNWGPLTKKGNRFLNWAGSKYHKKYPEPVYINDKYWEPYSDFQYETVAALCSMLIDKFPDINIDRIFGHSNVAPGRKIDPGPAWEWERFRNLLINYREGVLQCSG